MKHFIKHKLKEAVIYNGHKLPVGSIFHNDNLHANGYNREISNKIDVWINDQEFQKNPVEWVDVSKIVPTQKFVSKDNLDALKGIKIGANTKAYLAEYNGLYYIIDGHHRIAMQIMGGATKIKGFVQHIKN